MVRALLAGTKSQTRRILKPQPAEWQAGVIDITKPMQDEDGEWGQVETIWSRPLVTGMCEPEREEWCPLGLRYHVGDRLWVREAFSGPQDNDEMTWPPSAWFRGDPIHYWADGNPESGDWTKPKPSIHMPRWASRLTLAVSDVRVQRLQDISEEDARAEGVEPPDQEREDRDNSICPTCGGTRLYVGLGANYGVSEFDCYACDTHVKRYKHLWEWISGPGSWAENPFVAAITFDVRKGNIDG
jgi:hypothetical protein